MNDILKLTKYFIKGLLIGTGALIPGVSGGTVAIVLGVFEELLEAVVNLFKHFKKSLFVILPNVLGVIVSIIIFSRILKLFCFEYPYFSKICFNTISIISALLFFIIKVERPLIKKSYLCTILGLILSHTVTRVINSNCIDMKWFENDMFLIIIGMVLSLALILPAISFSYMLLFVGMYDRTLNAITSFDVIYLFLLTTGIFVGILIFSKAFLKITERYSHEVYCFIFGFVICASVDMIV